MSSEFTHAAQHRSPRGVCAEALGAVLVFLLAGVVSADDTVRVGVLGCGAEARPRRRQIFLRFAWKAFT